MSQNEKNKFDGKIQQCPKCKFFNTIPETCFGFKECSCCFNIFCFCCCKSFSKKQQPFFKKEKNNEIETKTSLEKENENPPKIEAIKHYNLTHRGIDLKFKTKNLDQFKPPQNSFEISVRTLTQKVYPFQVKQYDTILELKQKIKNQIGLAVDQQRCVFAGKLLYDHYYINDYGIAIGSSIHLIWSNTYSERKLFMSKPFVLVSGLNKRILLLSFDPNNLISSLQQEIKKKTKIDFCDQILLFKGEKVSVNKTFKEHGFETNVTLYLLTLLQYEKTNTRFHYNNQFLKLLENGEKNPDHVYFSDLKILEKHVHSLLIKARTKKDPQQIKATLEKNFKNQEDINSFLQWVYGDKNLKNERVSQTMKLIGMESTPTKYTLLEDISNLWLDNDSKDFSIIIKNEKDSLDQEEEEEEERVTVHKFVLVARSGLFREMFGNLNEKEKKINQIRDYSGRSCESLNILLKYLYTNSIKLTADNDPELILEELQDAKDYYQLGKKSTITLELEKIRMKYNLK
ncbi:polyubiquitin 8-related [Anaeramoeba flamelloides]|uniref:Polyubiquitin 8-related n=1 Tax=Anaeramoeba flamelloides TaxID=1746091 RepID=A0ABQ8YMT5_9EUKA|nr:polyubiquitin 8-related [Anaeramoeba flamelloides]